MITQETVAAIWHAYREIEAAQSLLKEMAETRKKHQLDKREPVLRDAFGRARQLSLGVPSGDRAQSLFDVSPDLAESVIRAHIEHKRAELAEANERARIELNT